MAVFVDDVLFAAGAFSEAAVVFVSVIRGDAAVWVSLMRTAARVSDIASAASLFCGVTLLSVFAAGALRSIVVVPAGKDGVSARP